MIGLLTWKSIEDIAFIENTKRYPSQKFHIPYHQKKKCSQTNETSCSYASSCSPPWLAYFLYPRRHL